MNLKVLQIFRINNTANFCDILFWNLRKKSFLEKSAEILNLLHSF